MSEAGLDPGTLMPKLLPALILEPKRCCGMGRTECRIGLYGMAGAKQAREGNLGV